MLNNNINFIIRFKNNCKNFSNKIKYFNKLRIIKFYNEIKRLNDNKNNLINFYKNNKHRFIYNNEIVVKIKNSKRDYNFFDGLISKKNI